MISFNRLRYLAHQVEYHNLVQLFPSSLPGAGQRRLLGLRIGKARVWGSFFLTFFNFRTPITIIP
jgi:hypothetical protein